MGRILIIGAGMGGLSTAMLLTQDGHDVTVLERDAHPPAGDADDAWESWERPGVNQFRMPHFLLPRWLHLARAELPQVVSHLEAKGALAGNPVDRLPPVATGGRRRGDERFDFLTARRPVVESAVAAAAREVSGLEVRRGVAVKGLLAEHPTGNGAVPHVMGVVTEAGEELRADLVVDAGGRRSPLPRWLDEIGASAPAEEREDSGFVYYARHYRSLDGSTPTVKALLLMDYESVSLLTLPADNGTWSVGFVASAQDRRLRALKDPHRYTTAMKLYPLAAHWTDGEPLTGVDTIAKIEDRYRAFVVDGTPVVTGLVAVGDAWACTNPSLGRGISYALLHAIGLRDLLRAMVAPDPTELALAWHNTTESELTPLYRATLKYDQHRCAEIRAEVAGVPHEPADPEFWPVATGFAAAAAKDADVLRAYLEVVTALSTPEEALSKPGVLERVIEVGAGADRYFLPGPSRGELLNTLEA